MTLFVNSNFFIDEYKNDDDDDDDEGDLHWGWFNHALKWIDSVDSNYILD